MSQVSKNERSTLEIHENIFGSVKKMRHSDLYTNTLLAACFQCKPLLIINLSLEVVYLNFNLTGWQLTLPSKEQLFTALKIWKGQQFSWKPILMWVYIQYTYLILWDENPLLHKKIDWKNASNVRLREKSLGRCLPVTPACTKTRCTETFCTKTLCPVWQQKDTNEVCISAWKNRFPVFFVTGLLWCLINI